MDLERGVMNDSNERAILSICRESQIRYEEEGLAHLIWDQGKTRYR
jgi:hypothetical protein